MLIFKIITRTKDDIEPTDTLGKDASVLAKYQGNHINDELQQSQIKPKQRTEMMMINFSMVYK